MGKIYNKRGQNEIRRKLRSEMSKAEVLLWIQLKGKQICGYKFRRQFGVDIYSIDFYCPKLKLAIEVDGATHFSDEDIEKDKIRQRKIEEFGIKFLRFTNLDIYDSLSGVIDIIKEKIKEIEITFNKTTP